MAAHHNRTEKRLESVVDVQALKAENPEAAICKVSQAQPGQKIKCDILIVGGGTGGVAAALAATRSNRSGLKVCLTEETDWLGGQMTAQGVSALDENFLVETSGACKSYIDLRRDIRKYYSETKKLSEKAKSKQYLDPGNCWVSRLAFEPKVCLDLLNQRLEPAQSNGALAIYLRHKAYAGTTTLDKAGKKFIQSISVINLDSKETIEFEAKVVIDATELGDLLPLCDLQYSSGSDNASTTTEPHAPSIGDAENVQDFVFPFVVEFRSGEHHVIEKPKLYEDFNRIGKFSFQGWKMFESAFRVNEDGTESELLPFWTYRRLIDKTFFEEGEYPHDVSMINWDSNDLRGENIIDKSAQVQSERLAKAKLLSLGFLYWLQTEAQRDDGGKGYPELHFRTDVLGSKDGLSKFPYIRESRRIKAVKTIIEQEIVASSNDLPRSTSFEDTVGIGLYPVDIHGHQEIPGAAQLTSPFQFSLASLVPDNATNLLPACKNIGVTHITNGAYRLHPIEWGIGEAQGVLAARVVQENCTAQDYCKDFKRLRKLQLELVEGGAPIYWFDDVPTDDDNFAAIQFLAATRIFLSDAQTLSFKPDEPVTEQEVHDALSKILPTEKQTQATAAKQATKNFLQNSCASAKKIFKHLQCGDDETVSRAQFARSVFEFIKGSHV